MPVDPWADPAKAAYAIKHCEIRAKRLAEQPGFALQEAEDLSQELLLHLVRQTPKYDPSRGAWSTFVDRITTTKIAEILRARLRLKRNAGRREVSLNQPCGDEGDILTRELPDESCAEPLQLHRLLAHERRETALRVLEGLPALHQQVWSRLTLDVAARVADGLGISRRQVGNILGEIRRRLEAQSGEGFSEQ